MFRKDIDNNIVILQDFNNPLLTMDRSSKQRINKDIVALNDTLDQMDLIYIFRNFNPNEAKYTFFSNAHGIFSRIKHVIGQRTNINKFKKTEMTSSIFFDHNV